MDERKAHKEPTFENVEFVEPFFHWYFCNIGASLIFKLFPVEEWPDMCGHKHHLVNKLYENYKGDKLEFWFSLDKKNKRVIFDHYKKSPAYTFTYGKKREYVEEREGEVSEKRIKDDNKNEEQ
jgi:hypothetical protein